MEVTLNGEYREVVLKRLFTEKGRRVRLSGPGLPLSRKVCRKVITF